MKVFDSSLCFSSHLTFVPFVVEQLGIKDMAEIGVLHAALSIAVLSKCSQIRSYYLIDPWRPFMEPPAYSKKVWNKRYGAVKTEMKQYGDRAHILRLTSLEAAEQFELESLDLVYLDANHSFKYVDKDIRAWWPKVRSTGYLAGHDLTAMPNKRTWLGVRKAVEANFGKQYHSGECNWDGVWIISKKEVRVSV